MQWWGSARCGSRFVVLLLIFIACSQGSLPGIADTRPAGAAQPNGERVRAWFERYDCIRRAAQMTPEERKIADRILDKKITLLLPGFGRLAAHKLLKKMIERYETAATAMKDLPALPETRELQDGYTRYFITSREVFQNSLKTLNNPLRSKKELEEHKQEQATLDASLKTLDKQLRDNYNIPPYTYKTVAGN